MSDREQMTEDRIAANLRLAGAYKRLLGMEAYASAAGSFTHHWPNGDRLTVAVIEGGYEYLWIDGPVSRDAAAQILATDSRREATVCGLCEGAGGFSLGNKVLPCPHCSEQNDG